MSKPITDEERPYLVDLGRELRLMREEMCLSRRALGEGALLGEWQIYAIEKGIRRTRHSTLCRLVDVLVEDEDEDWRTDVVAMLIERAGPALAPESRYAGKQKASRARRARRKALIEKRAVELVEQRRANRP